MYRRAFLGGLSALLSVALAVPAAAPAAAPAPTDHYRALQQLLDAEHTAGMPGVVPGRLGKQVTVRMLLNHTSGIGNYTDPPFANLEELLKLRYRTVSPRELVATGLAMPATNRPVPRGRTPTPTTSSLGCSSRR